MNVLSIFHFVSMVWSCHIGVNAFDVVGWYVGNNTTSFPPSKLNWAVYSHIVTGSPVVAEDGKASCQKTEFSEEMLALAKQHGKKITWGPNINLWQVISNSSWAQKKANYLSTIGQAAKDCGITGIEFDYEGRPTLQGANGIFSKSEATRFTLFMRDLQHALGPDSEVSADIGVYGTDHGSYHYLPELWVDVEIMKATPNLFVNTMSYHHPTDCTTSLWMADGQMLHEKFGLPKDRINIGIGYFSFNDTDNSEPLWSGLSELCPNIRENACLCQGIYFAGKSMNHDIAAWVKEEGYRGLFPWTANYDSLTQPLIDYVGKGLGIISAAPLAERSVLV